MDNAIIKRECAGLSHEYGTKNVSGRDNGFTLLEIIIVVTLVVLILGFTTLFFGNALPGARLNSTARELSAMIRYAKMLAQNNGEPQTVLINLDTGRYGIEGVQTRNIPEGINIRVTDPVAGEVSRGNYSVLFHESGIVEGGTITLWNTKRTINIELDPIVGSVVLK
jgi:prepilin-type N-terminal cleavage/methylation domain-containing protein